MKHFGTRPDGQDVHSLALAAGDISLNVLTHGAILHNLRIKGVDYSLTPGGEALADYLGKFKHHGCLIGPIANRISTARVRIAGMMYELERNQDGRIHLHSGVDGTHRQVWQVVDRAEDQVTLGLDLADGVAGLPGHRIIRVTYRVEAPAMLTMTLSATSYSTTLFNFANHSYWNLDGTNNWSGHRLQINAEHFLPTDADNVPTGEILSVSGTEMDLRTGPVLTPGAPALDHNFCLNNSRGPLREAAILTGSRGLKLTLSTTEPGLQVYDGRTSLSPYQGIALEAQGWPDAPNNRRFPSIKVGEGDTYTQITRWQIDGY